MSMFWRHGERHSLQEWGDRGRVLHLSQNERSGADLWFSNLLNACREGNMDEDDYNFLHGYPTEQKICFWYAHREDPTWKHDDENCRYASYHILDHWDHCSKFECEDCWAERKRRVRVLSQARPTQMKERRNDPLFADSVLITQYNMAVFYFAQERARRFARSKQASAFWIQAADSPPCLLYTSPSPRD